MLGVTHRWVTWRIPKIETRVGNLNLPRRVKLVLKANQVLLVHSTEQFPHPGDFPWLSELLAKSLLIQDRSQNPLEARLFQGKFRAQTHS